MSHAQDKRYWIGGSALAAVVIALAGWFVVISPQLSSASSLRAQADSVQQQNRLLESKIAGLKQQNDNLHTLTASLQDALAALPFDSGLPALTRELSGQAAQHRIDLTSIAVGSIGPTSGVSTAGSGGGESTGALFAIPVTLLSTGSAKDSLAFLKAIQTDGPRRALITSTQLSPASGAADASIDASTTMTTQLTVFTAPLTPPAEAQLEKLLSGDVAR